MRKENRRVWPLAVILLSVVLSVFAAEQNPHPSPVFTAQRDVAKSNTPPPGKSIGLQEGSTQFVLFIPDGWKAPESGEIPLTIQFHGVSWYAIREHLRHGLKNPADHRPLGEDRTNTAMPFEDHTKLKRLLQLTVKTLREEAARRPMPYLLFGPVQFQRRLWRRPRNHPVT